MLRYAVACIVAALCLVACHADRARVESELAKVADRVEGFVVVQLPAAGELTLSPGQSLTADDLRGVVLDDDPPVAGDPPGAWDPRMTDDCLPAERPYVAEGIAPFRLREFDCEFSYGGWHTWAMTQYASEHGFGIVSTYNSKPEDWSHLPAGTRFMRWGGFIDWHKWMPAHGLADGRWDLLVDLDLVPMLAAEEGFQLVPGYSSLMIDMEHGRLSPEKLREQEWYPAAGSEAERAAFEARYYEGYAQTYIAPVEAARRNGWRDISVYGWAPFGRVWFGLEDARLDPATDFAWNAFGRAIYDAVDILNPSVYCFYWSPQNVAYTLANIDLNLELVRSAEVRKPMRPYYWTLLHGGGSGERWWSGQPLPDEDVRAMTAMCFFTGAEGMVLWNWSGTGSHQTVALEAGAYVMVAEPAIVRATADDAEITLQRYDVIKLASIADDGTVSFRRVDRERFRDGWGVTDADPSYTAARDDLLPHLRPRAEPVAALVEGLALVKPFEYLLRHGEPVVDVSAQEQFRDTLPILRRVRIEGHQVIATYDPRVIHGGAPREIVLADFDGRAGLTLTLPADDQVRLFVLRDA